MTRSLVRRVLLIALTLPLSLALGQDAKPAPAFEVASVKPAGPLDPRPYAVTRDKFFGGDL